MAPSNEEGPEGRWLVVGLGNPGDEYEGTRHNAGFEVVDIVADDVHATYWKRSCGSLVAETEWHGLWVTLAKPQTFMNLSGTAAAKLIDHARVSPDRMVVVHDDLDLPVGMVRVKAGGSHGGHNGIRSIIDRTGMRDFVHVKVGIGRPPGRMPVADYVLRRPRGDESAALSEGISEAAEAVACIMLDGVQRAQSRFNQKAR